MSPEEPSPGSVIKPGSSQDQPAPPSELIPQADVLSPAEPAAPSPLPPIPETPQLQSTAPEPAIASTQLPPEPQSLVPESILQNINQTPSAANSGRFSSFSFLRSKKGLIVLVPLLILILGAGYYFAIYRPNQPANIWSSALSRTGKGYDRLTGYITKQKNIKAVAINGSFKTSGDFASDGTFNGSFSQGNGQLTESGSALGLKTGLDLRWIKSSGNSPDIYFKLSGVQGLGDLAASFTQNDNLKKLNDINDQWYLIDHTLFEQFASGSNSTPQISSNDVSNLLKKIGDSTKKYILTTDPKNASITVKQNIGKEKQDGRNVYHYKVGYNKQNLKKYFKELCNDLKNSKLKDYADLLGSSDLSCDDQTLSSADSLQPSDSADVWVDLKTKLLHKIRFTEKNKKDNYFEIGQNYTGGDDFPFFLNFHTKDNGNTSDTNIGLKVNMANNNFQLSAASKADDGSDKPFSGNFILNIKPANAVKKIEAPAGARNILQLLADLGLSQLFDQSASSSSTEDAVGYLLAGVNDFEANNDGQLPTAVVSDESVACPSAKSTTASGTSMAFCGSADTQSSKVDLPKNTKVTYINSTDGNIKWPNEGSVTLVRNYSCKGSSGLAPSERSVAAIYMSNSSKQCIDS